MYLLSEPFISNFAETFISILYMNVYFKWDFIKTFMLFAQIWNHTVKFSWNSLRRIVRARFEQQVRSCTSFPRIGRSLDSGKIVYQNMFLLVEFEIHCLGKVAFQMPGSFFAHLFQVVWNQQAVNILSLEIPGGNVKQFLLLFTLVVRCNILARRQNFLTSNYVMFKMSTSYNIFEI